MSQEFTPFGGRGRRLQDDSPIGPRTSSPSRMPSAPKAAATATTTRQQEPSSSAHPGPIPIDDSPHRVRHVHDYCLDVIERCTACIDMASSWNGRILDHQRNRDCKDDLETFIHKLFVSIHSLQDARRRSQIEGERLAKDIQERRPPLPKRNAWAWERILFGAGVGYFFIVLGFFFTE